MRIKRRLTMVLGLLPLVGSAWGAQPAAGPPAPRSAREAGQTDLTGTWVAQVTEDWRWRMLTPPVGDFESVPLNPAGVALAKQWNLDTDNANGDQCKAFGAGGIMRLPGRVRVSWLDDNTLKFEMDAGTQTRTFHFGVAPTSGERTLQGTSNAEWMRPPPPRGGGVALNQQIGLPGRATPAEAAARAAPQPMRGSLKVTTTHLKAGYLRKNGVPYSENAVITEYYSRLSIAGNDYLQVVTVVDDPTYLQAPFIVSNQFKREPDASQWSPSACYTAPPRASGE